MEAHMKLVNNDWTTSKLYFSDNPQRKEFCAIYGLSFPDDGWIEQGDVSKALFGHRGLNTVHRCTQSYGVFAWAPEFANVHSTFSYEETPILVDGIEYACSESYYQSMKSFGHRQHEEYHEAIRTCNPDDAWALGRRVPLRDDWDQAQIDVMRKAVYAKFTQNDMLRALLCSTSSYPLVQIKIDPVWGSMSDGSGANMLGVLLMELRDQLS